jgi:osmoprotectant transport system ATP-binding protein
MDPETPVVLCAEHVTKVHPGGTEALSDVSLEVHRGEAMAIVGESGAGKSTLLRCFNGLERPDAGEVRVGGRRVAAQDGVLLRRSIGYVPQEGGLFPHWTVLRNVALVPELLGWDRGRREKAAERLLGFVGLDPKTFGARYPVALSGGQKQRVAIARALCAEPTVLLLDEAFGALDAVTRRRLGDECARWIDELGVTTVFVTHDLAGAMRMVDRIAVMQAGRILQVGTPEEIRGAPAVDYVRELLECS